MKLNETKKIDLAREGDWKTFTAKSDIGYLLKTGQEVLGKEINPLP